jgi:uncharacterized protein (DUF2147 family)
MKKMKTVLAVILIAASMQLFAQTTGDKIIGKWKTKDNTILDVSKVSSSFVIKQVSAEKEKEKKDNGKQIGKDISPSSGNEFKGIVIDPSDNKEYKATWIMADDGKSLKLKVKWGLLSFSETWVKQ